MPKLESFNGKMMTKWEGLWKQEDGKYYSSATINLSTLKNFKGVCRMYLIKNKYYKKGGSMPYYLFRICDASGVNVRDITISDMLSEQGDEREKAHWEYHEFIDFLTVYESYRCSNCGGEPYYKSNISEEYKYCPYCGAEMEY